MKKDFILDGPVFQKQPFHIIRQRYGRYFPDKDIPRDLIYLAVPPDARQAVLFSAFKELRRRYPRRIADHQKHDQAWKQLWKGMGERYFDVSNPKKNEEAGKWTHKENARLNKGPWKAVTPSEAQKLHKGFNISAATSGRAKKSGASRQKAIWSLLAKIHRADRQRTKNECLAILYDQYSADLASTYGSLSEQRIRLAAHPETKKLFPS